MQISLSIFAVSIIASTIALPTPASLKRDLLTLHLVPKIDIDLLKNACIGAGVCNPVTVTENNPATRDLFNLDLAPNVDIDLLEDACVGAGVCNPVTVTENN